MPQASSDTLTSIMLDRGSTIDPGRAKDLPQEFPMHRTTNTTSPGNVSGFCALPVAMPSLAWVFLCTLLIFRAGSLPAEEEVPGDPGEENSTVIIGEGHVWRFLRGAQDPPADWN